MRGRLPWQGLKAKRDAKYLLVLEKKQATSASALCAGLPAEFEDYINSVDNLRDEDQPDYQYLRKVFNSFSADEGTNTSMHRFRLTRALPATLPVPKSRCIEWYGRGARANATKPSGRGAQDVTKATRRKEKMIS